MYKCKANKISLIVTVYNKEKYLMDCIESLINQTYHNIEIILIDDGSTDNSLTLCKNFEKKDQRIHVFHQENKGVSFARNVGIKKSKGAYIVFVDADDVCNENMLSLLIKNYYDYQCDISIAKIGVFNNNTILKQQKGSTKNWSLNLNHFLNKKNYNKLQDYLLSSCAKLFDANIISENSLFFNESLNSGEDGLFVIEYLKYCKKIVFSDMVVYYYRRQEDNTLTSSRDFSFKKVNFEKADATKELFEINNVSRGDFDRRIAVYKSIVFYYNKVFDKRLELSKSRQLSLSRALLYNSYLENIIIKYKPYSIKSIFIFMCIKFKANYLIWLMFKIKFSNKY